MNSFQIKNGSSTFIESQEDKVSSNEQFPNIPLINIDIGQILAQKAQILFPSSNIEQEFFTQGDIESAIDNFVLNLQSPLNKFDLNSTMIKMRSIADEQEKKIQKSINTDNQYTHDDAFGLQSAKKYSFQSKFQNDDNNKNESCFMDKDKLINQQTASSSYLNHSQSNTAVQSEQENEHFQTPLKAISQTNYFFNNSNENKKKIINNNKFNGSAGANQTMKDQQKFQTTKVKLISKNKQKTENNLNKQQSNQENMNKNIDQNNIQKQYQFQSLTEQKEIYSNQENIPQIQQTKQPQTQSQQFSLYPNQQEYNKSMHGQNENHNNIILMSAPSTIHYKNNKTTQYQQQQQIKGHYINNHPQHLNFNRVSENQCDQYMTNNSKQQQFHQNMDSHVQDSQICSNIISNQVKQHQNQLPHNYQGLQYPLNLQKELNQQVKENLIPKQNRLNSLESVQQQLNFDIEDNEGDLNKSPFDNNQNDELSLLKQNSNNINSFNCIDDFIEESRNNYEVNDAFKNNQQTFSPSLTSKLCKNQQLDSNFNQESVQCSVYYGQKYLVNNQLNIKTEESQHNQDSINEQYSKNQNLYDFLYNDTNSGLNLLIEDNNNFHQNLCDFDKYME